MLQCKDCRTTDQKVGGSNPSRRTRFETCLMVTGFGLIVDSANAQPSHAKIAQFAAVLHSCVLSVGGWPVVRLISRGTLTDSWSLRGHVLRNLLFEWTPRIGLSCGRARGHRRRVDDLTARFQEREARIGQQQRPELHRAIRADATRRSQ
jgi:hypothetical protein